MKLLMNLAAVGLVATAAMAQTVRVGTILKPSVVVAFYRSPVWSGVVKAKMAEMQQAKAANDTKKVAELDEWGQAGQELAHRQLSGEAPITNILEALAPAFPEIARKADVAMVVADLPYADSSVQTVDVTDLVLDWLQANEATRDIVRGLQKGAR